MKSIFFAIYDDTDRIVTTCENYKEMAVFFGKKTTDVLRNAVNRNERVRHNHRWYSIYKFDERKNINDDI